MKTNVIFLESKKDFTSREKKQIRSVFKKETAKAGVLLGIRGIANFTIYPFTMYIQGEPWIDAKTMSTEWIMLTIPPKNWEVDDLRATIYHEIHHIARKYTWYDGYNKPTTTLENIFGEGLATSFQIEQVPGSVLGYATYKVTDLRKYFPEIKKKMYTTMTTVEYSDLFFGEGKRWWLGYKMGTYLVDQIFKNNFGITHKELVRKDAKELLKLSRVKI